RPQSLASRLCASLLHHLSDLSFFLHVPAPTEIYTLSLHDALPIFGVVLPRLRDHHEHRVRQRAAAEVEQLEHLVERGGVGGVGRSEEHTSELQSRENLVCRLLLEKKKTNTTTHQPTSKAARTRS